MTASSSDVSVCSNSICYCPDCQSCFAENQVAFTESPTSHHTHRPVRVDPNNKVCYWRNIQSLRVKQNSQGKSTGRDISTCALIHWVLMRNRPLGADSPAHLCNELRPRWRRVCAGLRGWMWRNARCLFEWNRKWQLFTHQHDMFRLVTANGRRTSHRFE